MKERALQAAFTDDYTSALKNQVEAHKNLNEANLQYQQTVDGAKKAVQEFEAAQTPEAKFARTMDNIQPAMLNCATDGRAWKEKGVKLSQILERNKITPEGSKALWEYSLNNFIMPNVEKGRIINN